MPEGLGPHEVSVPHTRSVHIKGHPPRRAVPNFNAVLRVRCIPYNVDGLLFGFHIRPRGRHLTNSDGSGDETVCCILLLFTAGGGFLRWAGGTMQKAVTLGVMR